MKLDRGQRRKGHMGVGKNKPRLQVTPCLAGVDLRDNNSHLDKYNIYGPNNISRLQIHDLLTNLQS